MRPRFSTASRKRRRAAANQDRPAAKAVYDRLYAEYAILHDYFGRGANDVMKRLKALKAEMRS